MALGETPALPAGEHSLVGSAQPSEPFVDQKVCSIKRLAGSELDAAFGGQNIQYLPFSASLDAWAAETAALPGQKVLSLAAPQAPEGFVGQKQ